MQAVAGIRCNIHGPLRFVLEVAVPERNQSLHCTPPRQEHPQTRRPKQRRRGSVQHGNVVALHGHYGHIWQNPLDRKPYKNHPPPSGCSVVWDGKTPCPLHPQPNGRAPNLPIPVWRIPPSKGPHVPTPGSTNRHTCSAFMARTPPPSVKQDKSSGGSVDTTKTRSGPQRVRMSSGERPIAAAKGKQSDTEALCQNPPPPCSPRCDSTQSCDTGTVLAQPPKGRE